jgi:diguanylate cyclase (GGDEF)-like protein
VIFLINNISFIYNNKSDIVEAFNKISNIPKNQIMIQVFSGIIEYDSLQSILNELKSIFNDIPIIGTTTSGEILDGKIIEKKVVICITTFEKTTVASSLIPIIKDSKKMVSDFLKEVYTDKLKGLILFGDSHINKSQLMLRNFLSELNTQAPDITISGASSADYYKLVNPLVFTDQGVKRLGIAAIALYGDDITIANHFSLPWSPVGKKLTVTETEGEKIVSIDNMSFIDLYKKYLNFDLSKGLKSNISDFPLIYESSGINRICDPQEIYPDGSTKFLQPLHVGDQIRFGYLNSELMFKRAGEIYHEIKERDIQAAFIYSCAVRKSVLGDLIEKEIRPFSELSNITGFFGNGEYYKYKSPLHFLTHTMTITTLTENDSQKEKENMEKDFEKDYNSLSTLHRLIEVSTMELSKEIESLSSIAHMDALTGLYNRRKFDSYLTNSIKKQAISNNHLSLILIDVDYFKRFNDTYGHIVGDDCLRGIGYTLNNIIKKENGLAFRYGGEEFAIILKDYDEEQTTKISDKIVTEIRKLEIPHSSSEIESIVTISMGSIFTTVSKNTNPDYLKQKCDELLYEAKKNGRNRFVFKSI